MDDKQIAKKVAALPPEVREHITAYPHASLPADMYEQLKGLTEQAPVDPADATGKGEERFQLTSQVQAYLKAQQERS